MRPQKHFSAFILILLLLCASYAESAVFNVSTAQDFRAALNTAQSNGEDDTINLAAGTYKTGGASFNYQPAEGKDLTIQAAAGASAAAVILDGEQKDRAVYVLIGSFVADLELKNITITNGKKTDVGGGLYIQLTTGAITISGCIIKDSYSDNGGGGAWLKSTAPYGLLSLTIDGTTVSGNSAHAGGGIFVDGKWDLTMANTTISQNICPLYGGAGMYFSGGTKGTIKSCTFSKNVCYSGNGGGFRLLGGPLAISKSTFTENSASYGGGFNMENSNVTVSDCLFTGNSTPSDYGGGGAIMSSGGYSLSIERSTMLANSGYNGGAVFTNGCTTTLINNIIANNTAMINGGGLYLVHGYSTASILTHNTITNNEAKTNGDGIYFEMLDNRAKSDLYNTIIYNNGAEDIYIKGSATITAKNCTYKTIAGQSLTSFADTVDSDPLFVNASGNDFHLQDTSPCINKGTASAAQMPKTDFEGDARNSLPDIGADENKNVPAPGTTTTTITTTTVPGGITTTIVPGGTTTTTVPGGITTTTVPGGITTTIVPGGTTTTTVPGGITTTTIAAAGKLFISGKVTGDITDEISVNLAGSSSQIIKTEADGVFEFQGLAAGSYVVMPVCGHVEFTPAFQTVVLVDQSAAGISFASKAPAFAIEEASAEPSSAPDDGSTEVLFTAQLTAGAQARSVSIDLSSIGGLSSQKMYDDGTSGDKAARDGTYSFQAAVAPRTSPGQKGILVNAANFSGMASGATVAFSASNLIADTVQASQETMVKNDIKGQTLILRYALAASEAGEVQSLQACGTFLDIIKPDGNAWKESIALAEQEGGLQIEDAEMGTWTYLVRNTCAEQKAYRIQTTTSGTGIISGLIVNAATGKPVLSAAVATSTGASVTVVEGYYLLVHPASDTIYIYVAAGGFAQSSGAVSLEAGGSASLDFALLPLDNENQPTFCPLANAAALDISSQKELRLFRDAVLAKDPFGKELIALYYQHAAQVNRILLESAPLCREVRSCAADMLPSFQKMISGQQAAGLTADQKAHITKCLKGISKGADAALKAALDSIIKSLNDYTL